MAAGGRVPRLRPPAVAKRGALRARIPLDVLVIAGYLVAITLFGIRVGTPARPRPTSTSSPASRSADSLIARIAIWLRGGCIGVQCVETIRRPLGPSGNQWAYSRSVIEASRCPS